MKTLEGQRLILNSQLTIENGTAGYFDGHLWLYFTGYTLQETATIFFDPANTATIVFQFGDMAETYEGFTDCVNLSINSDGNVSVCMIKGGQ